ncbi:MAG: dynamin family protein [Bacteroidales bacterium]|nr:dynamin family protein [Bacteroidales bacterium]
MKSTEEILNDIKTVGESGKLIVNGEIEEQLGELKIKIEENKFYIVVAGLFKRGKSSVINVLINKPIAPVAVTPLTSTITFFENRGKDYVEVVFENGKTDEISAEEIRNYVDEEKNPKNVKKVSLIKVSVSNSELLKKCCLVDTPGLGSVFDHNSKITYNYIPKIDAALFILGADVPIAKADADFLKKIYSLVPRIIYMLNKTDLLEEQDLQKIIGFNKRIIAEITSEDEDKIIIVPVSCKLENQKPGSGNFDKLLNILHEVIDHEKANIVLENSYKQLKAIAGGIRRLLIVQAETLQMPVKEIEEKQVQLHRSVAVMNDTDDEFDILIKGQLNRILENQFVVIDQKVKQESLKVKMEVNEACNLGLINEKEAKALANRITGEMLAFLEIVKNESEKNIREEFYQLLEKYQNRPQSYLNEFSKLLSDMFGVDFEIITSPFNLNAYSSFYFLKHIQGYTQEIKSGFFYKIMPKCAKINKFKRIITDNTDALLEVNSNRMKSDISYQINESFRKFTSNAREQMDKLFEKIDKMLTEAKNNKEKAKKKIADRYAMLKKNIQVLEKI